MNYTLVNKNSFIGHTLSGTFYGEDGVKKYAAMGHGPDGAVLLDPQIGAFIKNNVGGKRIIDLGCGAAPWTIRAAKEGAKQVIGIDIQERMIEEGYHAYKDAGLSEKQVTLEVGDVMNLPYRDQYFDCAMTLMVGCNLPTLCDHFTEMARVLREKGRAIVTAPASLGVVFTSGERELSKVMEAIEQALEKINVNNPESIVQHLSSLTDIYSATFFEDEGELKLLTESVHIKNGVKIWRKLPANVIPNVFHAETEYITEAQKVGFKIIKIDKPTFGNVGELTKYNQEHFGQPQLGNAYIEHNPFMIMELEKEKQINDRVINHVEPSHSYQIFVNNNEVFCTTIEEMLEFLLRTKKQDGKNKKTTFVLSDDESYSGNEHAEFKLIFNTR